jgi:hypothetical protein
MLFNPSGRYNQEGERKIKKLKQRKKSPKTYSN